MKFSFRRKTKPTAQKTLKREKRKQLTKTFLAYAFGDKLANSKLGKERWVVVVLISMGLFYIANRYAYMQEEIYIQQLENKLKVARLDALAKKSELIEMTTQKKIEKQLKKWHSDVKPLEHPIYRVK
jgi:hypothetical protein